MDREQGTVGLRLSLAVCLLIVLAAGRCLAAKMPDAMGCCMTDPGHFVGDTPEHIRRRFDLHKSIGVDTLRVGIEWRELEGAREGQLRNDAILGYLKIVKEYGFRIKLIVGVLQGPPGWFLDQHPDAQLTDENGGHSRNTVSFWYPGLHKLIEAKTRAILDFAKKAGVLDQVVEVIPSFGPAGEPIYPVPWTLGPGFPKQTYWCYDSHAQADFRAKMRAKYKSVESANKAWGTAFATWEEVKVLKPETQPGAYWNDVLTWYRDSKREFISWQVDELKKLAGPKTKVVLYVPGTAYSDADWAEAVRTARGNDHIMMMADSLHLIDLAASKGCRLQYTGVENAAEVERLRRYLDEHKYSKLEMWGENAGNEHAAGDPAHLADVIIKNKLFGLDYTHAHYAFEKDQVTPNKVLPELAKAYARIRETRR